MNNVSNILNNYELALDRVVNLEEFLLVARKELEDSAAAIISSNVMSEALRGNGVIHGENIYFVSKMKNLRQYIEVKPMPTYSHDLNAEEVE